MKVVNTEKCKTREAERELQRQEDARKREAEENERKRQAKERKIREEREKQAEERKKQEEKSRRQFEERMRQAEKESLEQQEEYKKHYEERLREVEERKRQKKTGTRDAMTEYVATLCSGILLPDTCFLMDLGEVFFYVDYREKASGRTESVKEFILLLEEQCRKLSSVLTLHRHVYREIQRLYNGEDREKSKKAQGAKKLIERWQKLGIIQTYPDLEDKEKSYYADDALLKYMGELLEQGETVRLLTNDLDLRIRARDRFEKLGKALPEDMLLSLDDILAKWPR